MSEQQKQVKAALKECVAKIKELKAIRRENRQWSKDAPGWVNGPLGYDLDELKRDATFLCAARAAAHKRQHAIRMPRTFKVTGVGFKWVTVKTQEEFAAHVEAEVAERFPTPPPAEAAAPEQRPAA